MPAREIQVRRNSQLFAELCSAVLRRGHNVAFRVDGASMQPNLQDGDDIVVTPAQSSELHRGDVALVQNSEGMRVHRVVHGASAAEELLLRSDTALESDPPPSHVFGKVILRRSGVHEESFQSAGTPLIHRMRRVARRLRMAATNRLRRVVTLIAGILVLLLFGLTLAAPSARSQADLSMTQTPSVTAVDTGVNFTYTEAATNSAASVTTVPANQLVIYEQTPANTVFEGVTATNWTCATPLFNARGPIICTFNNTLAPGASTNPIVITLRVSAGTAYGTTILNSATVTSQTTDPVPTNNTTQSTVYVEQAANSDLAISITATPTPVFVFTNYVYSVVVQNLGQAAAPVTSNVVTITLPTGVSFVSSAPPAGWTCSGAGPVNCSISSPMAANTSATINVTVTAPSAPPATPLTATAQVSLPGDPDANNNSASLITIVQPLVCATPGRDGTPGAALTGVVNAYYSPAATGTLAAGATSVTLGAAAAAGAQTPIAAGDLLLIMQMQDATINSTNTSSYGDGAAGDPATGSTALGSSGLFEFVTATTAIPVTGGALQFQSTGSGNGLLNSYVMTTAGLAQPQQTYQVIRVPQYLSVTLSSTLVPMAWNGKVGGVLALDVSAQLTLAGTVSADALGFRAGGGKILGGGAGANTDYVTLATNAANASKGEGIAGSPRYIAPATIALASTAIDTTGGAPADTLPKGSFARGAPGNAGGGGTDGHPAGNDFNSGGGAGGNGGAGGVGGYGWNSFSIINTTNGGFGGSAFPASTSALVMGGGGGAGTTNNGSYYISNASNGHDCGTNCTGIYSSGGSGGGIVIVHAGSVTGAGTITANGQATLSTLNDSTGGGGAGGSIIFFANSGSVAGLTAFANGGSAGNAWPIKAPGAFSGNRHGPGGGGGGGVIFLSGTPASASVTGGNNGYTNTVQDSYGATPGQNGVVVNTHIITENPGAQAGAYCAGADLTVSSNTAVPTVVAPGGTIAYTQVVQNLGPMAAVNAVFSETVPANTTFQSIVTPAGWTCSTPAVGGIGNITCTDPLVANGASSTFTVNVLVGGATTNGTQIVDVTNVTSGTNDPNLANNSATAIVTVGTVNSADLAITNTPSSPAVAAGSNYTLTAVVINQSAFAAAMPTFMETIPLNTTFVSLVSPAGWTCSTPTAGGTGLLFCKTTAATMPGGAIASFPIVLNVNAGTPSGTQVAGTANVSSSTPDPNPTNNSATGTITVASAGQVDLAVTSTATPNPVSEGNNITYTQSVVNNGPVASTNATFTEAIPANTTLVSFPTPASWTCTPTIAVGGTGTFNCTLNVGQTIAVNGTVSFPLVVKVNPTTPPGTIITNTPTVSSTAGDPNSANNSATTSVTVASPSQADVSILKTASPEPVNQGTNLTYTLQVTNGGPAVAQGVTVTDPLPGEVTYTSSFTSQGSCAIAVGTVTCTLGSLSVGSTAVITINVNATTFSSASTSENTATVSSTTSDPNLLNNSSTSISDIQSPTAVDLSSFHAFSQADGTVLLEWRTHEESRNLGFHIYREQSGQRNRINPSLIAGSALLLRGSKPQHAAKTYRWIDTQPVPGAGYSIEDLDINGTHTSHGPVYAETGAPVPAESVAAQRQSALLSQLHSAARVGSRSGSIRMPYRRIPIAPIVARPTDLDDLAAVKVAVDHEGWYRVSSSQLATAGLTRGSDLRTLHLYTEGVEQPLLFGTTGALDSFDGIEFYGTPIDNPFSGQRSYWLVRESHEGNQITKLPALSGGTTAPTSFPFEVLREDRTTYFAALLNGENNDNFFGATVTTDHPSVDQELDVTHFDATSSLPIALDLTIQGAIDGWEHLINVQLNGVTLGTMDFIGLKLFSQTFSVQPSLLQDGANTVTLTALNGDNDVSVVQSIELHYPHTYAADSDWLRATAPSGTHLHLTEFSNAQIRAFDITDPLRITELSGKVSKGPGSYELELTLSNAAPAERTILAFADTAMSSPVSLSPHAPSNLDNQRVGADVVIISYPDFVPNLAPLVKLRESQDYRVQLVTTDQIYDQYNFGERSPFAIRSFLNDAVVHWRRKPQFILLVGGASFDPRDYLGLGEFDFVPTRLIETAAFKTASDDWFTDFSESGFGTIPIGRLPARTPDDVDLLVSKIVNYEHGGSGASWNSQALFIADQNIDANFSAAATTAATTVPSSLQVSKIFADGQDSATARSQILAALNSGSLLVNYHGHGSEQQWSFSDLFDTNDSAALSNGNRLPVYILMDCLNGFFQDVYAESLGVSLLMAPNGGAVSVWTSSGFTDEAPQASMNLAFFREFSSHPSEPIGKIALIAKKGTTNQDVRRTWNLLGDPAMKFQFPAASVPPSVSTPVKHTNRPFKFNDICTGDSVCSRENNK
jgi:uncharacterized repeat protein (TIGR01451 family)